jgi:hypothetical protein
LAQSGFTAEFEMGSGGARTLWSPGNGAGAAVKIDARYLTTLLCPARKQPRLQVLYQTHRQPGLQVLCQEGFQIDDAQSGMIVFGR